MMKNSEINMLSSPYFDHIYLYSSKIKKALIIGISGQDGAYLAHFLLSKGYLVYGTSRDAQITSFFNLKKLNIYEKCILFSADPVDFRSMLNVLVDVDPDEIYNLAGQSSVGLFKEPVETFNSLALANLNILEVIRFFNSSIRYYNACSCECFGNTPIPATEDSPFHPRSPYGVAKATAFWQVANYRESYGLFVCSGILFNHESPLRPTRFVTQKIIQGVLDIVHNKRHTLELGNLAIARDWGLAEEYVEAMWRILQQKIPTDFIIATGSTYNLEQFVDLAFQEVGLDWKQYVVSDDRLLRPSDITESRACPKKAEQLLGWKAMSTLPQIIKKLMNP